MILQFEAQFDLKKKLKAQFMHAPLPKYINDPSSNIYYLEITL